MTELTDIIQDLIRIKQRVDGYGQDMIADEIEGIIDRLDTYAEGVMK